MMRYIHFSYPNVPLNGVPSVYREDGYATLIRCFRIFTLIPDSGGEEIFKTVSEDSVV